MRLRSALSLPWNPSGMDQPGTERAPNLATVQGGVACKF